MKLRAVATRVGLNLACAPSNRPAANFENYSSRRSAVVIGQQGPISVKGAGLGFLIELGG